MITTEENNIKNKGIFTNRIRTLFRTGLLLSKSSQKFVNKFKKLIIDSKWGALFQNLYADLIMAKQYGQVNLGEFRENCREMLTKLVIENPDKGLAKIDMYPDFWTMAKNAAQSFLSIFKGPNSKYGRNQSHTEYMFRILKTIVVDESIFNQLVRKKGKCVDFYFCIINRFT